MLEKIADLIEGHKTRIKEKDITDVLSLNIWKTRARIFEDILASRTREGKEAPKSSIWHSPETDLSLDLFKLTLAGVVNRNYFERLTSQERAWVSRTDTFTEEEREISSRLSSPYYTPGKSLAVYRLSAETGRRQRAADLQSYPSSMVLAR